MRQQGLHVASTIGNHVDRDSLGMPPIDNPVGFEKNLAIFDQAQSAQLFRHRPAIRQFRKPPGDLQ